MSWQKPPAVGALGLGDVRYSNLAPEEHSRVKEEADPAVILYARKKDVNFRFELALEPILQTNELRHYRSVELPLKFFLDSHGR